MHLPLCRMLLFVQTCNFAKNQTTSERLGKKKGQNTPGESGTTITSGENGPLLHDASVDASVKNSKCFLLNCMRMCKGSKVKNQDQLFLDCTSRTSTGFIGIDSPRF